MLVSRNAVLFGAVPGGQLRHVAVLYMTLGAPFIALAQVTVYAGAIMVLFLFVIMLLGAENMHRQSSRCGNQRWLALAAFVVLLVEALVDHCGAQPDGLAPGQPQC